MTMSSHKSEVVKKLKLGGVEQCGSNPSSREEAQGIIIIWALISLLYFHTHNGFYVLIRDTEICSKRMWKSQSCDPKSFPRLDTGMVANPYNAST